MNYKKWKKEGWRELGFPIKMAELYSMHGFSSDESKQIIICGYEINKLGKLVKLEWAENMSNKRVARSRVTHEQEISLTHDLPPYNIAETLLKLPKEDKHKKAIISPKRLLKKR